MSTPTTRPAQTDLALLVARVALGGVMIAHGAQKAFQFGFAGTQQAFSGMGAPLPGLTAVLVTLLELVGGVAVILGLATRLVAALYALTMLGAAVLVHLPNGFYAQNGGWELVGLLALVALALVAGGPGRLSLDRALFGRRRDRASRTAHAAASPVTA